jgi:hypothetical protein
MVLIKVNIDPSQHTNIYFPHEFLCANRWCVRKLNIPIGIRKKHAGVYYEALARWRRTDRDLRARHLSPSLHGRQHARVKARGWLTPPTTGSLPPGPRPKSFGPCDRALTVGGTGITEGARVFATGETSCIHSSWTVPISCGGRRLIGLECVDGGRLGRFD